jgi:hypothetical protein
MGRPSGAVALLWSACAAVASAILPFSYPYAECAVPNAGNKLALGDQTYVCLNFNGRVTSMFNVRTDEYTAVSIQGCE